MLSISESRPSASRMEIKKISSFIIEFSLFKSYFEVCSFVLWHCSPRGGWKRKNLSIADVSNELMRSRCFNSGDAWVSTFDFLLLNLCYFILHFKTQCQINISLTVWRQSELTLFFFLLYQNWFFDYLERFSQNCPSFSRTIPFNLLPLKLSLFILSLRSLLSRFFAIIIFACRETFNCKKLVIPHFLKTKSTTFRRYL